MNGEQRRRRNIIVGAMALMVIAGLFVLGVRLQAKRKLAGEELAAAGDRHMARGIAGQCPSFERAQACYLTAMQHYLQNKDLAGKAEVAGDLAKLCGRDLTNLISTRRRLLAVATPTPADVKELALAQLAGGDREGALRSLAHMPDDPLCQWLSGWLRAIPPAPVR